MIIFNNRYRFRDFGLLVLRLGIGPMLMFHGLPLLMGGAEKWREVGSAVSNFGLHQGHEFFGYMVAFVEFGGGILLALGLFHRIICFLLFIVMSIGASNYFLGGQDLKITAHVVEGAILFLSLLFIGPGRFSLDQALFE